jgi:hypothetical protein
MTRVRMMWYAGTVLTALAMLAASATAVAQPQGYAPRERAASVADSSKADRQRAANIRGFRGIAVQLNTTPQALQDAFVRARLTNPTLSRGNFVAANVLADNLGAQHPGITTAAILSGLRSGKSLGQTLQSFGLSSSDAKQARQAADRDVKDADRRIKDADNRDQDEQQDSQRKARRAERAANENEKKQH